MRNYFNDNFIKQTSEDYCLPVKVVEQAYDKYVKNGDYEKFYNALEKYIQERKYEKC